MNQRISQQSIDGYKQDSRNRTVLETEIAHLQYEAQNWQLALIRYLGCYATEIVDIFGGDIQQSTRYSELTYTVIMHADTHRSTTLLLVIPDLTPLFFCMKLLENVTVIILVISIISQIGRNRVWP